MEAWALRNWEEVYRVLSWKRSCLEWWAEWRRVYIDRGIEFFYHDRWKGDRPTNRWTPGRVTHLTHFIWFPRPVLCTWKLRTWSFPRRLFCSVHGGGFTEDYCYSQSGGCECECGGWCCFQLKKRYRFETIRLDFGVFERWGCSPFEKHRDKQNKRKKADKPLSSSSSLASCSPLVLAWWCDLMA